MAKNFISSKFTPPFDVLGEKFILRKLTVKEVEKDYEAVMSSKESLRQIFCIDDDWPSDDMTIADNYKDLEIHENEFDNREGFAYTVVNLEDTKCLGCVYIFPWNNDEYNAQVFYWVTDEMKKNNLETDLSKFLSSWLKETWSFSDILYPGRNLSFEDYNKKREQLKIRLES